jgi:hypothetical protein
MGWALIFDPQINIEGGSIKEMSKNVALSLKKAGNATSDIIFLLLFESSKIRQRLVLLLFLRDKLNVEIGSID